MNWDSIKGFTKSEFAPTGPVLEKPWEMDSLLMLRLHNLRKAANMENLNLIRFVVKENGGFSLTGHSEKSLHGQYLLNSLGGIYKPDDPLVGRAADFTIEEKIGEKWVPWSWLKQAAFVFGKIDLNYGLGIYPWWHRPGLHLDRRHFVDGRNPAIWARMPDGQYITRAPDRFYDLVDIILNCPEVSNFASGKFKIYGIEEEKGGAAPPRYEDPGGGNIT